MTHIFKQREALIEIVKECGNEAIDKIATIGYLTEENMKYLPRILTDFTLVFTGYIMEENDQRINGSKELDEILRDVARAIIEYSDKAIWEDIDADTLATWLTMMQTEIFWHFYPNTKIEELI
jgi:hypothetical protein